MMPRRRRTKSQNARKRTTRKSRNKTPRVTLKRTPRSMRKPVSIHSKRRTRRSYRGGGQFRDDSYTWDSTGEATVTLPPAECSYKIKIHPSNTNIWSRYKVQSLEFRWEKKGRMIMGVLICSFFALHENRSGEFELRRDDVSALDLTIIKGFVKDNAGVYGFCGIELCNDGNEFRIIGPGISSSEMRTCSPTDTFRIWVETQEIKSSSIIQSVTYYHRGVNIYTLGQNTFRDCKPNSKTYAVCRNLLSTERTLHVSKVYWLLSPVWHEYGYMYKLEEGWLRSSSWKPYLWMWNEATLRILCYTEHTLTNNIRT